MTDPIDRHERRIMDGTSWNELCDRLRDAGQIVMREGSPNTPFDRAEGYRYLSRILRAALQTFVEHADPLAPVLQRVVHETAKMGSDNPDNYYMNAAISGEHAYRLWGKRGSVHYLSFGTQLGHYGKGAGMPMTGFLESSQMKIGADGSFEIALSVEKPAGDVSWLPMTRESGTLIVRQTRLDREREELAEIHIERVGGERSPSALTPKSIDEGLMQAGNLVGGAAMIFATWAEGFKAHVNRLPEFDRNLSTAFGGDPNIVYYHSYWQLAPDEALVIDAMPPECDHWNFQLNNHWMESLDYRYFHIHVNSKTARYREDGSVRIVVAHSDPGVPNWIETAGHDRGTMCFRWVRAKEHPQPATRVVKIGRVREL
jgi:hypothetical protein